MKNKILSILIILLMTTGAYAQDCSGYNGKTVRKINIKAARISPEIVREKFLICEGDVFYEDNYAAARQALHDMRIFKSIDFSIEDNGDDTITINIDAKDGSYIFPLLFGTGGSNSTIAAALIEANLFKAAEFSYIFGAASSDGYVAMAGLGMKNNSVGVSGSRFKYDEKVFDNGSYSTSGLFSSSRNYSEFSAPVNEYNVDATSVRLFWSKTFHERSAFSAGFNFADVTYSGTNAPNDQGSHNKITLGYKIYKNIQQAGGMSGMGALFGVGLSDIKDKLADLPHIRYGYLASANYENGGAHTDSDYSISKLYLKAMETMELKKRHVFTLEASAAKAFEAPFFEMIRSREVLSGRGIYSREFRGEEAVGATASFMFYLFKNRTGFATFIPFAESSVVWDNEYRRNLTGVGASLSYRLWRIPFPIGINFTQNATDGSNDVSFLFGGGF